MFNSIYQNIPEPSNREVWYTNLLASVEMPTRNSSTLNRYANKILLSTRDGKKVIEFIKKTQLYLDPDDTDQYYFVDSSKRFRPDLISLEMYGTPILYWVVLASNNLDSPLKVETNLTLRLPQLTRILSSRRLL